MCPSNNIIIIIINYLWNETKSQEAWLIAKCSGGRGISSFLNVISEILIFFISMKFVQNFNHPMR